MSGVGTNKNPNKIPTNEDTDHANSTSIHSRVLACQSYPNFARSPPPRISPALQPPVIQQCRGNMIEVYYIATMIQGCGMIGRLKMRFELMYLFELQ